MELMKRENGSLQAQADFFSLLNWTMSQLYLDPSPYEVSTDDFWYGDHDLEKSHKIKGSVSVRDEAAKLNLNFISEERLELLWKKFLAKKGALRGDRKDFSKAVLKRRAEERFQSLEELWLLEDVYREDVEKLRPFITVYSKNEEVNLNTASFFVIELIVESLDADSFAKRTLLRKLKAYQQGGSSFRSEDMLPREFAEKLELEASPQMTGLIRSFLLQFGVSSNCFELNLRLGETRRAETILCVNPNQQMEIHRWWEN